MVQTRMHGRGGQGVASGAEMLLGGRALHGRYRASAILGRQISRRHSDDPVALAACRDFTQTRLLQAAGGVDDVGVYGMRAIAQIGGQAAAKAVVRWRQVALAGEPIRIAADIDALYVVRLHMQAGKRPAWIPFGTLCRRTTAFGQRCSPTRLTGYTTARQAWPQTDTNSPPRRRQGVCCSLPIGADAGLGSSSGTHTRRLPPLNHSTSHHQA